MPRKNKTTRLWSTLVIIGSISFVLVFLVGMSQWLAINFGNTAHSILGSGIDSANRQHLSDLVFWGTIALSGLILFLTYLARKKINKPKPL